MDRRRTRWTWLGQIGYGEAVALQHALRERLKRGEGEEHLLLLEHPHVYTLGRNASGSDVVASRAWLAARGVEVHDTDRGGQVTYHGPGQLVVYPLLDLERARLGVRSLVEGIERAIVGTLAQWHIEAFGRRDAPGVYVGTRKIASVGLRIRRGCSYHGLALNVAMDLEPFRRINPCGYAGLEMTQVSELGGPVDPGAVADALAPRLLAELGFEPPPQSATSTWRQDVSSM